MIVGLMIGSIVDAHISMRLTKSGSIGSFHVLLVQILVQPQFMPKYVDVYGGISNLRMSSHALYQCLVESRLTKREYQLLLCVIKIWLPVRYPIRQTLA